MFLLRLTFLKLQNAARLLTDRSKLGRAFTLRQIYSCYDMQQLSSVGVLEKTSWVQCDRCDKWRRLPEATAEALEEDVPWYLGGLS